MKIVCISGKAQHGKDTTAKLLEEILEAQGNRVLIAHYGDLVKYVCKTFFGWDGKKDEKGRTLLQRVGTDKIRAVSPDYWVDFIVSILDIFCDEWDYVLIPDASQDDPQLLMEEYLPIKNFELLYGWWKQHYKATLKDCDNPQAIILHLASTD